MRSRRQPMGVVNPNRVWKGKIVVFVEHKEDQRSGEGKWREVIANSIRTAGYSTTSATGAKSYWKER